ncbi:FimV/HubP family polar landmark protein [Halomonas beimenensis]|uniref:LysM domain-containing protein n=2 Tax=Halomonas beimenensis TaxID=475662 RepID=A0A291P866_9GAMM|nr:FimV/HubP family polar landmark protein [Halomonas beimenensis]ATJ83106.1 hypothetical protein BEI_2119 [Halomonas beimenensis]
MKRKLTLTTLLPLSLASPLALALGLGDVEVRSTLNAPLRASIPLTDTAGLQAGLLNASIAGAEAYRVAGLARTPLAASVQLEIQRRQGRLVLDLATERAVREPWLDLLLRFDWPGGRQLREVTLLLDPPDYAAMPALVEGADRARLADSTARPRAPSRAGLPASSRTSGDPARVRSGDTLWAVAGRLRPDSGIGMNQMMLALVEANPEVFPTGNINDMRAGYTLVVPPRAAIAARSPSRAAELVQAMNRAWAGRGAGAPARVPLGGAEAVAGAAEAGAPLEGGEASGGASAVERGEATSEAPRLTLLTEEEAAGLGGAAEGASAAPAGSGQADDGEAAPRVRIEPGVLAAITGGGALTEDERLLRLERRWEESRAALSAVQAERDALEAELAGVREELSELRERVAALAAGGAGVEGAGAGGVVPPEAPEATGQPAATPWWGALYQAALERPLMSGGAGIAALLALWALVRRRRSREEEPAFPFGEVQVAVPHGEASAAGAEAPGQDGDAPRPVKASMPEAQAINEADIFIAYGRYDQARELLEAGLAREPERDDLRVKLLRVLLEQGEREAAEREATRLRASADPATQAEVERLMGRLTTRSATAGQRAVFSAADERPPRHFAEPGAAGPEGPSDASPPRGEEAPSAPASERTDPPGAEDLSRYRPPRVEPEGEAARAADAESRREAEVAGADEGRAESPSADEEALPQVTTRVKEDGSQVIDYRPPSLDPEASTGDETPMQPSVDFTPQERPAEPLTAKPGEGWDVEEVAFPPLGGDNTGSADEASSAPTLNEARHLIELGEVREARLLLERLLEEADDTGVREEARDLLDRHQP